MDMCRTTLSLVTIIDLVKKKKKRDASRPGTLPLEVPGSLVGTYLYTVGQETLDATVACSHQVCAFVGCERVSIMQLHPTS